jgi:hypothetical protein
MFRDPAIAGSWHDLADRLDDAGALARWATTEPALSGATATCELVGWLTRGCDAARADAVLAALVRLAAADGGDEPDAVLLLLHVLADGAVRIADSLMDLRTDILFLVVGELTLQIRAFPWRRRTRAIAANLLLDTKLALWRELRPHRTRTYPGGGDDLIDPHDTEQMNALFDAVVPGPGDDGLDLVDVLMWAERTGVVAADEATLLAELVDVQTSDPHERSLFAQEQVAARRGVNHRTVRRHRDRALARLRAVSGQYLAACA